MPKITKKQIAEALQGSVKKWERIVKDARAKDDGIKNCPLCVLLYRDSCDGCPVDKAGYYLCGFSPYGEWRDHQEEHHDDNSFPFSRTPHCPDCLRLAKEELAFLKSLKV